MLLDVSISNSLYEIVAWTLASDMLSGECHSTSLTIIQYRPSEWLGAVGQQTITWANDDLVVYMTPMCHNVLNLTSQFYAVERHWIYAHKYWLHIGYPGHLKPHTPSANQSGCTRYPKDSRPGSLRNLPDWKKVNSVSVEWSEPIILSKVYVDILIFLMMIYDFNVGSQRPDGGRFLYHI